MSKKRATPSPTVGTTAYLVLRYPAGSEKVAEFARHHLRSVNIEATPLIQWEDHDRLRLVRSDGTLVASISVSQNVEALAQMAVRTLNGDTGEADMWTRKTVGRPRTPPAGPEGSGSSETHDTPKVQEDTTGGAEARTEEIGSDVEGTK